jgi:hypothetical protein
MTITIIEDASPFFIRFKFDGIEKVIDIGRENLKNLNSSSDLAGFKMVDKFEITREKNPSNLEEYENGLLISYPSAAEASDIVDNLPWPNELLNFKDWAFEVLQTGTEFHWCVHKDRSNFGLNFFIDVPDDLCVTNFYSEEEVDSKMDYERQQSRKEADANPPEDKGGPLRRTYNVDMHDLTPIKSYVGVQGEGMLINADIWHTWNNTSTKARSALLLRPKSPLSRSSFEEIRLKLFGF